MGNENTFQTWGRGKNRVWGVEVQNMIKMIEFHLKPYLTLSSQPAI